MKICSKCKIEKDESEFHKCSCKWDGLQTTCKSCKSIIKKIDKEKNSERIIEYGKKYYLENKERITIRDKVAYDLWKKDYYRQYGKLNRTKIRIYQNSYQRSRKLAVKGCINTLTNADIKFIFELQNGTCCACGKQFSDILRYEIDHILALKKGGSLTLSNIQLLCRSCNASKQTKFIDYLSYYICTGKYYKLEKGKEKGDINVWFY